MGRRPTPIADKRRNRLMLYLTDPERDKLQTLSEKMGLDKTELLYEGLHTLFQATDTTNFPEVQNMRYPEHQDTSSLLDKERYGRKLGDWLPGDPCKVRFFAAAYANQRDIVQALDGDHCLVQLRTLDQPVRIAMVDLIYWDDEDEFWVMAPLADEDKEVLNSAVCE